MWWMTLLSCWRPSVPGVPQGSVRVAVSGDTLEVEGRSVSQWSEVGLDPTSASHGPLIDALGDRPAGSVWFELPSKTPFLVLRKLIHAADHDRVRSKVVSMERAASALPMREPPRYGLQGSCPSGPLQVLGAEPLISLSIQMGDDGTWLLGTARLLPVVEYHGTKTPVDGLPPDCLLPVECARLFEDQPLHRGLCEAARAGEVEAPARLRLGNETGCLAPIVRTLEQLPAWRQTWSNTVSHLELDTFDLLLVMPEARVELDVLMSVLRGFVPADGATDSVPPVAAKLLLQGNDGPPVCNATVRDRASLGHAAAAWLGTLGASHSD